MTVSVADSAASSSSAAAAAGPSSILPGIPAALGVLTGFVSAVHNGVASSKDLCASQQSSPGPAVAALCRFFESPWMTPGPGGPGSPGDEAAKKRREDVAGKYFRLLVGSDGLVLEQLCRGLGQNAEVIFCEGGGIDKVGLWKCYVKDSLRLYIALTDRAQKESVSAVRILARCVADAGLCAMLPALEQLFMGTSESKKKDVEDNALLWKQSTATSVFLFLHHARQPRFCQHIVHAIAGGILQLGSIPTAGPFGQHLVAFLLHDAQVKCRAIAIHLAAVGRAMVAEIERGVDPDSPDMVAQSVAQLESFMSTLSTLVSALHKIPILAPLQQAQPPVSLDLRVALSICAMLLKALVTLDRTAAARVSGGVMLLVADGLRETITDALEIHDRVVCHYTACMLAFVLDHKARNPGSGSSSGPGSSAGSNVASSKPEARGLKLLQSASAASARNILDNIVSTLHKSLSGLGLDLDSRGDDMDLLDILDRISNTKEESLLESSVRRERELECGESAPGDESVGDESPKSILEDDGDDNRNLIAEACRLSRQIAKRKELVDDLQAKLASLNMAAADAERNLFRLQEWRVQVDAKKKALKAERSALEAKNTDLKSNNTELEAKCTELQSSVVKLEAKKTELEANKTELEAKKTELEAKTTELEAKTTELEAKTTELEAKTTELQARLQLVSEPRVVELRRELGARVDMVEKLTAELEAEEAETRRLSEEVCRARNWNLDLRAQGMAAARYSEHSLQHIMDLAHHLRTVCDACTTHAESLSTRRISLMQSLNGAPW